MRTIPSAPSPEGVVMAAIVSSRALMVCGNCSRKRGQKEIQPAVKRQGAGGDYLMSFSYRFARL
jgi:hypothetical protein